MYLYYTCIQERTTPSIPPEEVKTKHYVDSRTHIILVKENTET